MVIALFIICPFLALLWAFYHPENKKSHVIIVLYWGLIGLTRKLIYNEDATYSIMLMNDFSHFNYHQFIASQFVSDWKENVNFLYWNIMYLISKLQYTALMWVVIMMISSVTLLYCFRLQWTNRVTSISKRNRPYIISYFILFLLFLPITSYGVKFYYAVFFFMIGLYLFIYKEVKIGIIIACLSCLCHYTFLYMIFVGLIYYFTQKKSIIFKVIIFGLFMVLAYIFSPFLLESEIIQQKYENYTDMAKYSSIYSGISLWILLDRYILALFSLFAILYFRTIHINDVKSKQMFYYLTIFLIALFPLVTSVVAFDRFSRFISLLTLLYIVRLLYTCKTLPHWFLNIGIFVYSYHAMVSFYIRRVDWDFSIFYNSFIAIIYNADLSTIILNHGS